MIKSIFAPLTAASVVVLALSSGAAPARAENVEIIPWGSTAGEFCARDRAMLFKDPSGVNILIQPGRTVGPADPRLADVKVHVILLDHAHGDHSGDEVGVDCEGAGGVSTAPDPNIATIAVAENSAILVGGELVSWLRDRTGAGGCSILDPRSHFHPHRSGSLITLRGHVAAGRQ